LKDVKLLYLDLSLGKVTPLKSGEGSLMKDFNSDPKLKGANKKLRW